jgi:restriction system protein
MTVPKYDELFDPLLQAMHELGGSASIIEQEDRVVLNLGLSESDLAEIHRGNTTKLHYRLAWARTYLKNYGLLDNSARGVWALTAEGNRTQKIDKGSVKRAVNALYRRDTESTPEAEEETAATWEEELLELLKSMPPDGFERLCQRLLRESGFTHVEVTGKSGDEGVDGKGVTRLGGILSFHVIFQCKRYKGSVGSAVVRDFRGAMVGRADKGLIITTATFTRDARREAQRDGATPIDLIDGEELVGRLKELRMGVQVTEETIEDVQVDPEWFENI